MTTTNFPKLFKKTSTGAIQFWKIRVIEADICTYWGQVNGAMQEGCETIAEGKNLGKANATTAEQQAVLEAQAQWEKKKKRSYVQSIEQAQQGKVDTEVIKGGVDPMLAKSYDEHGHKIVYPAIVSAKLDGHRCIAVVENGRASLWSRTRKPINSMPHIVAELEKWAAQYQKENIVLDGELYVHAYKDRFEQLTSLIRSSEPAGGHEIMQFHVYDVVCEGPYRARMTQLRDLAGPAVYAHKQVEVADESEMLERTDSWIAEGYEGLMIRNADSLYEHKRSVGLQKVKRFDDAEWVVVGVEEGRGKLAGHAIFVCSLEGENAFRVKLKGDTSALKGYFDHPETVVGHKLTVKYQGMTKDGVPRFPVGLRVRVDI